MLLGVAEVWPHFKKSRRENNCEKVFQGIISFFSEKKRLYYKLYRNMSLRSKLVV